MAETQEGLAREGMPWARLPALSLMTLVCVLILVRAPPGATARFFFITWTIGVIFQSQFQGANPWQTYVSKSVFYLLGAVVPSLLVTWALFFPPEVAPPRRGILLLPWLLVPAFGIPRLSYLLGGPIPPSLVPLAINGAHLAFAAASIATVTWNYRRSPPIGRRRIKWVLWSVWLASLPIAINAVAVMTEWGRPLYPDTASWTKVSVALLPIGLLLAMQRQSLFDIDRVLGATATYTLLLMLAAVGISLLVPPAARAASDWLGLANTSTQLVFSTALTLALIPLQVVVRPRIDRLFFTERFTAQVGVERLLGALDHAQPGDDMLVRSGAELQRAFGATRCVLYVRRGQRYVLAFSGSSDETVPPYLDEAEPLIAILRKQSKPLVSDGRSRRGAGVTPLERATLETLGAELVAPIRTPSALLGFVGLGRRRSGDIYTPTDAALAGSVAAQLSIRVVQEEATSLRTYVPEAVRAQIDERRSIPTEEREVSVLFVDIRGYTNRVARSDAHAVFDVLNEYTVRVSEVVRCFGGQVVEFHGDGLMAVFGAPEALASKERCAVLAALEIGRAVTHLDAGEFGSPDEHGGIEVGVGVATGTAFVGNIRAVDRWIWSAVGYTTNLAARLQGLTRDLDAAIVIDDATREAAGEAADGFIARPDTAIRGLPALMQVHVRPRAETAPA